jgi:hypothetical protein
MTETLQALFGFALIGGLFVWYFRERRAKRATIEPVAAPIVDATADVTTETPVVSLGSPNWGAPIFYVIVLLAIKGTRGWWSIGWLALYFAVWALAFYSTFSPSQLREEQERRPGTTRRFHYLRFGVPYVLFPLLGWFVAIRLSWLPGVLIPALPWVVLVAAVPFIPVRRAS